MTFLFWLKKIIGLFFMPLQFALIIGVIGVVFIWLRKREKLARIGRVMITLAVLVLLLASNRGVAIRLARPLESAYAPIPELKSAFDPANPAVPAQLAACKYVLVLGSGHADAPARSRINQLSNSGRARLAEALRILRVLPPDTKLIVSGYHLRGPSHAQVSAEAAESLGIDPGRIIRMDEARDTDDEIRTAVEIANGAPVALVTSAWHMPRAMHMCGHHKLDALACPADYLLPSSDNEGALAWFRFELGAFECSSKAIRERIGRLFLLKNSIL
ncbi:ElyC/SanA/YdcF family protein [Ereboglobus luteus]|nr:ElyC/SanA/YdcF family protein [Ereboglobus luteus]